MNRLVLMFALCGLAPAFAQESPGPETWDGRDARDPFQDEKAMLGYLKKHAPPIHDRMVRARDRVSSKAEYQQYMERLVEVVSRHKGTDPASMARRQEMRAIEGEIRNRMEGADQWTAAERRAARADLEQLVGKLFALRQQERKEKLEKALARIEALRTEIAERDAAREDIIDQFVGDLLDPVPEL